MVKTTFYFDKIFNMIKVIFFDIDGTLVPIGTRHISDSNIDAIKKLQEKNIKCVLCTGRDIRDVGRNNDVLEKIKPDGIIASTGQYCVNESGKPFYIKQLDDNQSKELLDLFYEKKYSICLKTENDTYLNYLSPLAKDMYEKLGVKPWPVKEYNGEKLFSGLLYSNLVERKEIENNLKYLKFTSWSSVSTDIIPLDGGKTKGIEKYLEKENIDISETMAFGDSENDIEMLEYVKIGVAMGNGNNEVKSSANYITDDCDKEGIYKALVHFGII